jgi:hypothetical protein|tara:strand:+ start:1273 stop:1908 length:636 start_codon:yes stop_codon:yes gene_type:complete
MNYADLIQSVQDYTQNDEATFVAELPNIVKQVEDRIYHMVQLPALRKTQSGTLTASNRFLSTPTDFISVFSLAVVDASGNYVHLMNKDVNFLREAYPAIATEAEPRYYALWDEDTFVLSPTPDAGLSTVLTYFYKPESIVTASTTWLGDENEAVLLYGCLVEAYTFMKGDQDLIQLYDTKFKEALVKLKELGDGKNRKDAYRSGQVRMAVS